MSSMGYTTRDRHLTNYHSLITATTSPFLDAARLYWVPRHGEMVRRSWQELTATERILQDEADRRAAEVALNDPCELGVY